MSKQIFSLIDAYNTTGELPKAFTTPEPKDTGLIEGLIERSATLLGDSPFYIGGAFVGSPLGPTGAAATAGFIPGTIRQMYITALQKGEVNTFEEWWKIFTEEGIKAGATEAAQLVVASKLPGILGVDKYFVPKVLAQVGGFEGTTVIDRTQYGVGKSGGLNGLGDNVTINITLEVMQPMK